MPWHWHVWLVWFGLVGCILVVSGREEREVRTEQVTWRRGAPCPPGAPSSPPALPSPPPSSSSALLPTCRVRAPLISATRFPRRHLSRWTELICFCICAPQGQGIWGKPSLTWYWPMPPSTPPTPQCRSPKPWPYAPAAFSTWADTTLLRSCSIRCCSFFSSHFVLCLGSDFRE